MRVAHIVQDLDPAMGGLATVPVNMARWQAKSGVDVELWTAAAHGAHEAASGTSLRVVERPGPRGLFDGAFVSRFGKDLRRVDIVHTHSLWRPYTVRFMLDAHRLGKPVVHTMHGMLMDWPMAQKTPKKRLFMRLIGRRALASVGAVHLLNRRETEQSRHVGVDFRHFELPNGVDTAEFAALPAPGAYRATDPSLAGRTIIASMGRLHDVKGVDLLLRAFLDLAADHPETALVLAGPDEGMRPALEAMLAGHAAAPRVKLPGLVRGAERLALLADADVFVQASRHETMSMSILEAAYAGRCLVVSDRCNAPEVAESGAGFEVPTSVQGLRDGLRRALGDPAERIRRGAAARRMIEERFTMDRVVATMIDHYRRLLAGEHYPWVLGAASKPAAASGAGIGA